MFKYLLLSLVAYYIINRYFLPPPSKSSDDNVRPNNKNTSVEDDFVDYEEIK